MSASPSPERPGRKPRVVAAVLLTFLFTGLGHLAIGHPRRGLIWLGGVWVCWLGLVVGSLLGLPLLVFAAVVGVFGVVVATAVDTVRLPRPAELPEQGKMWVMAVGLLVAGELTSLGVKRFVVESFKVPVGTMEPTLVPGDHMIVRKFAHAPRLGDVVVFEYPLEREVKYVKRVVGLGGDTIEIRNGKLNRNGAEVANGFEGTMDLAPLAIPAGHVYVMGDNRDNSNDSRVFGSFSVDHIIGRVLWVWWSRGPEWSRGPDGVRWDRIGRAIQ